MKVLQVLPSLDSGGVERGTVEFARELVARGYHSLVMSSGGRLVSQLEQEGSRHFCFPVHRKSVTSLFRVSALRRQLLEMQPDVIHVRSRMPAWMVWLALRNVPAAQRPVLISTFHGLYSINRYSAIMACGDRVIAISDCVQTYIRDNYPAVDASRVRVIHRGVDLHLFNRDYRLDRGWLQHFYAGHPATRDVPLLLMPARLTRWKGQRTFIELIARLRRSGQACHGLIVGETDPGKEGYLAELEDQVRALGLQRHISFLGHRADMANMYALASLVFNLSEHPEPFGRTVIEALAMGVPVVAWDEGGPAESLRACLPQGLVSPGDLEALVQTTTELLNSPPDIRLASEFTLQRQADATLDLYQQALRESRTALSH